MKKILLFLFTINCFAQAPNIEWEKYLGGTATDLARCIKQTSDGGYIVAGFTESNDGDVTGLHGTIEDFWVVKLDENGNIQWQRVYGGTGDEEVYSIAETADGGYIVAGYATYPNNGDVSGIHSTDYREDFWIIKLDVIGTIIWKKALGGSMNEVAKDIKQTSDGGYIVIGSTMSNDGDVLGLHGSYPDAWVIKMDNSGNIQWQKCYGGSNYEYGNSIIQTPDGGYAFTGTSRSFDGDLSGIQTESFTDNMWVVKINASGNIEWQKIIDGGGEAKSISLSENNGYVIFGEARPIGAFNTPSGIYSGTGVVKLDTFGSIIWAKFYEGKTKGNVIKCSDNNYAFCTTIVLGNGNNIPFNWDLWVVKISSQTGSILWQKNLGRADSQDDEGFIQQTNDNKYIVSGTTSAITTFPGYHGGGSDYYVIKLSEDNLSTSEFTTCKLFLFPNPTHKILNLQLCNETIIDKLIVTDMSGKKIIEFIGNLNQINIENLAKGTYLIQAFSGKYIYQRKFIKE